MKTQGKRVFPNYALLSIALFVILFAVNLMLLPDLLSPRNIFSTLALAAPLIIAAMAAVPPILSGGGGIDISIGATMGLINVGMFTFANSFGINIENSWMTLLFFIFVGALVGLTNGFLVTIVRLQPIVATLGMSLILTGISVHLMPNPTGMAPDWLLHLAGFVGPVPGSLLIFGILAVMWLVITRLPYHRNLLAVGGDDRAAFSAGLPVIQIRILAYVLGGMLAAVAGIALTAFVGSGDPNLGSNYGMLAIAAATLGGTSLSGGRGGMIGAVFGALDIFIVEKLLTAVRISSYWFQVAYGMILLIALIFNSLIRKSARKQEGA